MDDRVASLCAAADGRRVREIALDELATQARKLPRPVGRADQRGHFVSALAQLACDETPDESGRAG
jgi:hypothetical protein